MLKATIHSAIHETLKDLGHESVSFVVEYPTHRAHGAYASNVALVLGKKIGKAPQEVAKEIITTLTEKLPQVARMEIAGPGFINFFITRTYVSEVLKDIEKKGALWGRNKAWEGKTVIVEYTDPNPFKELHIGHLVPNALGESLARLFMASGASTKRVTFQGDVGIHVAKAVYGLMDMGVAPKEITPDILGKAYAHGATLFEESEEQKKEITALNKVIYERSDEKINELYDHGKAVSLEYFEKGYALLGSAFDKNFFESETGVIGAALVRDHIGEVFEESEGAVVFRGEKYGLHTRVFINSEGLPTYESKDVGLVKAKYDWEPFDLSITVTGTEQLEYFKVTTKASELIQGDIAGKVELVPNGMLRLKEGKMSSRTGNVVRALDFIHTIREALQEKTEKLEEEIQNAIAVGAIKYAILKIAPGKDIIFDQQQSVSFEGDSGPYLQYTRARILSVVEKAKTVGITPSLHDAPQEAYEVEELLLRYPEYIEKARDERAPHYLLGYLTELAGAFNTFYGNEKIADPSDPYAPYKCALSRVVGETLKDGLWCLGIEAPEEM